MGVKKGLGRRHVILVHINHAEAAVAVLLWNITRTSEFRKIDVDAFGEDALHNDKLYDPDPRSPDQVLSDARQRQAAVRSTLSK